MSTIKRHLEKVLLPKLGNVKGFSDLSEKTGLSESTIRKVAKGVNKNPTMRVVDALNDAFGFGFEVFIKSTRNDGSSEMKANDKPEEPN